MCSVAEHKAIIIACDNPYILIMCCVLMDIRKRI